MKTKTIFLFFCLSNIIFACSHWRESNHLTNTAAPTNAFDYNYYTMLDTDTVLADLDEKSLVLLWKNKNHSFSLDYTTNNFYRFFILDSLEEIGRLDIDGNSYDNTLQEYTIFSAWFGEKIPIPELRHKSLTFHSIK